MFCNHFLKQRTARGSQGLTQGGGVKLKGCGLVKGVNCSVTKGTTDGGRLQVRVAGHCFTITETTQTFTKMLTLGLNIFFLGPMLALVKVWLLSAMVKR